MFSYFQPVLVRGFSVAFGMEVVGPLFLVSGAVVLAGVWVVQVRGDARPPRYTRES